jgi:hypothetical protein
VGDPEVRRSAEGLPVTGAQAYAQSVAWSLLHDRRAAVTQLRRQGLVVTDALPEVLTTSVVGTYLSLKETGMV